MFRVSLTFSAFVLASGLATADPVFVNGLVIPGDSTDDTRAQGANAGRLGMFSDIYYDASRGEWWGLSDRGPGGGVIDYATRVQLFSIQHNKKTGEIFNFKVLETVRFQDYYGLLSDPANGSPSAMNGLNPLLLNGDASVLGQSFDPEGFVIDPRDGKFIVADEYGPSLYKFARNGRLEQVFETPANLVPRLRNADGTPGAADYVAVRGDAALNTGTFFGRQDNRGYEGLAVTPDGKRLVTVLQDPLINEPGPNNGRNGRNVRIVMFDNDLASANYGKAIAQYAYQLEPQANVSARIIAAGGSATATDPRQGRNIGLSAIVAINQNEFLVLERDNRGLGVDDPVGANVVGSKRVYRIDLRGATDVSAITLPGGALPSGVTPVAKSAVWLDLAAISVLPNGKKAEKWEGLAIGPVLQDGSFLILAGNDNDYSVTQNGSNVQFDVYVDFAGNSVQRDLDQHEMLNGINVGPVPAGYVLIPGVLNAYRAAPADLPGYIRP
ncbi:MAG: esterase-like activity of phytase family protein [Burkholderiales bacterium]